MQTHLQSVMPESANFMRQVELNSTISGSIALGRFQRLAELLASDQGEVEASLKFGTCAGYACVKGSVTGNLKLECQRCLQPMAFEINSQFKFAFIDSEDEIELIPDEFEPYLIEGDEQSIVDIFEDELLLSLPMVAVHETACSEYMTRHEQQLKAEKEAAHPFAALKALKTEQDDSIN